MNETIAELTSDFEVEIADVVQKHIAKMMEMGYPQGECESAMLAGLNDLVSVLLIRAGFNLHDYTGDTMQDVVSHAVQDILERNIQLILSPILNLLVDLEGDDKENFGVSYGIRFIVRGDVAWSEEAKALSKIKNMDTPKSTTSSIIMPSSNEVH